uniref:Palmitoyltransferase n=1 Tax=Callorhinchus milii TaxID=7868 RepID=A0A4W3IRS7_CALMI
RGSVPVCVCVCVSGDLSLYLRQSEQRGDLLQPVCFVLLVLCSVLLYFIISLMDPGYVTADEELSQDSATSQAAAEGEKEPMIPGEQKTLRLRRCGYCLIQQPMRAKHCHTCQHCVRRYDHHCPWIENCVGERNHRLFVLYLALQLFILLWGFHIAWSGFSPAITWNDWLRLNAFLLMAFVLISVCLAVVLLLLVSHLYLVSNNTTTWEFMSRHRISYLKHCSTEENPFDQGIVKNLCTFFCVWKTIAWENIYFRNETNLV